MNTLHAVLYRQDGVTRLTYAQHRAWWEQEQPVAASSLNDLAAIAYPQHVSHLWVMPDCGEFEPQGDSADWRFSPYINRRKKMMGAAVRKRGHQAIDVNIIFPEQSSWWGNTKSPGWIARAAPREVIGTLYYLEQALGITVTGSPGRTGWHYLKKIHPEWIEDIPGLDLRASQFTSTPDIIWRRPLLSIERKRKYIHKFDKSAAYPYAGTQTDVGVGTPVHLEGEAAAEAAKHEKGHPQDVGIWHCIITHVPLFPAMPPPWDGKADAWIPGPLIRLMRKTGYELTIQEGMVFPARHDVLVKWGLDLWKIRNGFLDTCKWTNRAIALLAQKATKQIMNATVGMTAFSGFDVGEEMKRPDIRLQVIARHRELTWHNIEKVRVMYGVTPVLVYMDAVYYISDEPDGRKVLPELVKREGQFGGYRWEGRVALDETFTYVYKGKNAPPPWKGTGMELFSSSMYNEANILEALNAKGWIQ